MLRAGEVERLVDRVRPADGARGERIRIYAMMVRTYFEAYFLAAKGLVGLPAEGVPAQGLDQAHNGDGAAAVPCGRDREPRVAGQTQARDGALRAARSRPREAVGQGQPGARLPRPRASSTPSSSSCAVTCGSTAQPEAQQFGDTPCSAHSSPRSAPKLLHDQLAHLFARCTGRARSRAGAPGDPHVDAVDGGAHQRQRAEVDREVVKSRSRAPAAAPPGRWPCHRTWPRRCPRASPAATVISSRRSTAGWSALARCATLGFERSTASVYCTRSLVPTEKKSHSAARASAISTAAGHLDHAAHLDRAAADALVEKLAPRLLEQPFAPCAARSGWSPAGT